PATRPPPRTRSRLGRFVDRRGTRSAPIAPSGTGSAEALRPSACAGGLSSSAKVFQPLHSGQRPSHLVACAPHSVQAKIVAAFLAIVSIVRGSLAIYALWSAGVPPASAGCPARRPLRSAETADRCGRDARTPFTGRRTRASPYRILTSAERRAFPSPASRARRRE